MAEGTQACELCESGEIEWKDKEGTYLCNHCGFELNFGSESATPTFLLQGKHFLGSFIGYRKESNDLEQRLRSLHTHISMTEEWKRRKLHFEQQVNENKYKILTYWKNNIKSDFSEFEKGEKVLALTKEYDIPISVITETLIEENVWSRANFGVWTYRLIEKYKDKVKRLWNNLNPTQEKLNSIKAASAVKIIADSIGINPYGVAPILDHIGVFNGGKWCLRTLEKTEEYGLFVANLWNNRKIKAKDDWSLCEVIDSISKDSAEKIDSYTVLEILTNTGRLKLDCKLAYTTYSKYKYAKLALELISHEPKTYKNLQEELNVSSRVVHHALSLLKEKKLVKSYKDRCKVTYYYTSSHEKDIEEIAAIPKWRNEIINSSKPYITVPEFASEKNLYRSSSGAILDKFAEEGNLVKICGLSPNIYVIKKEDIEESIAKSLTLNFYHILNKINENGITKGRIFIGSGPKDKDYKLGLLQTHDLLSEKNDKYYLTERVKNLLLNNSQLVAA